MTTLTDRDAELAALLGHKQTESTWKPTVYLIARFREDTLRLAREAKEQPPASAVITPIVTPSIYAQVWALFAANIATTVTHNSYIAMGARMADEWLVEYKKRFGNDT